MYDGVQPQVQRAMGGDKVLENPTRVCMIASQGLIVLLRDVAVMLKQDQYDPQE